VSGHQDKWKHHNELDWWEQTNVCMDFGANSKMLRPKHSATHPLSSQERWSLWADNHKYTSFDQHLIYDRACEQRVASYWLKLGRLTDASARQRVDKDVLAAACMEESPGFCRWVTKTSQVSVEWANGLNAGNGKIVAGAHVVTPQKKIIGTFTLVPRLVCRY
jgi:hypothetical protein